mmetsp:Transcript_15575/g.31569  ORF Transcript_15575/g.31569 Transcript_15575/m.31569 type:complete len:212 (-) Transcript_15575:497-1132(-)
MLEEAREPGALGDQTQLAQALEERVVQAEPVTRNAPDLELPPQLARAADVNHLPAAPALFIALVLSQGLGHGSFPFGLFLLLAHLALAFLLLEQMDRFDPGLLGLQLLVLLALGWRDRNGLVELKFCLFFFEIARSLSLLVLLDILQDRLRTHFFGFLAHALVHFILYTRLVQSLLQPRIKQLPPPQHCRTLLINHVRAVVLEHYARLIGW